MKDHRGIQLPWISKSFRGNVNAREFARTTPNIPTTDVADLTERLSELSDNFSETDRPLIALAMDLNQNVSVNFPGTMKALDIHDGDTVAIGEFELEWQE